MWLYADRIGIIMPTLLIEALKPFVHVSLSLVEVELFKGEAWFRPQEPDDLCSDWHGSELLRLIQGQACLRSHHGLLALSASSNSMDNAAIKADFEELYRIMNNKPLQEVAEIIYAVCSLCSDYEKTGFIEGVKVEMSQARVSNIK